MTKPPYSTCIADLGSVSGAVVVSPPFDSGQTWLVQKIWLAFDGGAGGPLPPYAQFSIAKVLGGALQVDVSVSSAWVTLWGAVLEGTPAWYDYGDYDPTIISGAQQNDPGAFPWYAEFDTKLVLVGSGD
jgi:hypothetical protein